MVSGLLVTTGTDVLADPTPVMDTGNDEERHLAGCSALLRSSQGLQIDPAAPTLRHAAFWVYVRQVMYNACVYQQSPDLDVEIDVAPLPPSSPRDCASKSLEVETAWTNALVWLTAKIMHYGFQNFSHDKSMIWQTLTSALDEWEQRKPTTFQPIWQSESGSSPGRRCFPSTRFIADWHGMYRAQSVTAN